jgi:hypothetical protein
MRPELTEIEMVYEANVRSVNRLMGFDSIVVETVIEMLDRAEADLENRNAHSVLPTIRNHRDSMKNIRRNESVKAYYDTMLNQCVVLLVSHFGSAVHDALRLGIREALGHGQRFAVTKEEIRVKMSDLWITIDSDAPRRADEVAELLINQHKVSFQDMQSIARAFDAYLGVETPQGGFLNDIIIAHATRHCIVHSGGRMTLRAVKQIGDRKGDRLQLEYKIDEPIQYERPHVEAVAQATGDYLRRLLETLDIALTPIA